MRIVILHDRVAEGARQDEVDALIQADAVSRALAELGHEAVPLTFSLNLTVPRGTLRQIRPDLVFNLVESVGGLGRFIHIAPALLDYLQLRYTGSSTEAIFLTSNKLMAKNIFKASGILTPPWVCGDDTGEDVGTIEGPFIIKSVWEHASIGLGRNSVVHVNDPYQLRAEMDRRREELGGDCFAEVFIEGREFNLSLLASQKYPEVLPPAEIRFVSYPDAALRIVDYDAKWNAESFAYHHTPRSFDFSDKDTPLVEKLTAIARDCWHLFGLRGYARVDFRVDSQGRPWVLEVNANPCLSPDSGFVAAANRAGLTFAQMIGRIIEDSMAPWPVQNVGRPRTASARIGSEIWSGDRQQIKSDICL